ASKVIVGIAIVASFLLLLLFVAAPVGPARVLGTASIVVLAGTSIVLFGSIILSYAPLAAGYPGLLLPVILWSVLCSLWNDNHPIRTRPADTPAGPWKRDEPGVHFKQWLTRARAQESRTEVRGVESRSATADRERYPIFIVAAAGGGIRAAYWTAALLGRAAEDVAKQNGGSGQVWRHHLYALSGVSGGSLGATVHVLELAQLSSPAEYVQRSSAMLGSDHLSPVVSYMLYPDLLQRFLPFPIRAFDRARGLESSWQQSADQHIAKDAFPGAFRALWKDGYYDLPALLLNSTRVETGQRVIVSNLVIPTQPAGAGSADKTPDFLDAVDLIGVAARQARSRPPLAPLRELDDIRVSSAVHLSARFTYVSPAARVERTDGSLWGRLVDGGYFENSGAATAADLIRAVCPDWDDEKVCDKSDAALEQVVPVVLLIKNDPQAPSLCDPYNGPATVPRAPLTELKPPIDALLATREARGRLAERAIVRLVEDNDRPSGDCSEGCVLELSLAPPGTGSNPAAGSIPPSSAQSPAHAFHDPPLGWSLSESSRKAMDDRLSDPDIHGQLQCVADLASGHECNTARRCSP
ncbi:MAG: patatin-like phospholipase family protein, partial [Candidatus Dormibacteraeota bacterium]|nr:patatin-like phospholipase family protein [Candidatus Dormibacteraeota bacterium]